MMRQMSSPLLTEWMAFINYEAKRAEKEREKAKRRARR